MAMWNFYRKYMTRSDNRSARMGADEAFRGSSVPFCRTPSLVQYVINFLSFFVKWKFSTKNRPYPPEKYTPCASIPVEGCRTLETGLGNNYKFIKNSSYQLHFVTQSGKIQIRHMSKVATMND